MAIVTHPLWTIRFQYIVEAFLYIYSYEVLSNESLSCVIYPCYGNTCVSVSVRAYLLKQKTHSQLATLLLQKYLNAGKSLTSELTRELTAGTDANFLAWTVRDEESRQKKKGGEIYFFVFVFFHKSSLRRTIQATASHSSHTRSINRDRNFCLVQSLGKRSRRLYLALSTFHSKEFVFFFSHLLSETLVENIKIWTINRKERTRWFVVKNNKNNDLRIYRFKKRVRACLNACTQGCPHLVTKKL